MKNLIYIVITATITGVMVSTSINSEVDFMYEQLEFQESQSEVDQTDLELNFDDPDFLDQNVLVIDDETEIEILLK